MLTKFNLYQPAAIDNSLNSYQIIHKIIHEINLIIDEVNNIDTKANEYTDEQIRLLKAELQIRFNEVETMISGLSDRIDVTESQIQGIFSELTTLRNIMNSNFTQIYNRIEEVNTSLTLQIQDNYIALYHYIDSQIEMIEQLINSISENKVFGLNGKLTTVQDALNQITASLNMSRQFLTYKDLINCLPDNASFVDSTATPAISVRIGDVTYKDLIDGLTRQAITSLYISKYFGANAENEVIMPNFINACRRPLSTLYGVLECTLSQHISPSTSYYGMGKAIGSRFTGIGIGYSTILYDYSGRYS